MSEKTDEREKSGNPSSEFCRSAALTMKRAIFNSALLALTLLVVAGNSPPAPAQAPAARYAPSDGNGASEAARRGEGFRREWKIEDAEAAFREAVTLDPTSRDAMLGLARVARARFRYGESLRWLEKAKRHHPDSEELFTEFGQVYLSAEEAALARGYFERALRLKPAYAPAAMGLAAVDLLARDYKGAEARLRDCLVDNPQAARAYTLLGRVLLENNKNREAAEMAERASRLDPYDIEALLILAFVKATERKPDEVRALARRALALDPFYVGARRLLSQYLRGEKGYEQKMPEAAQARYERGRALKEEGKLAEAVAEFEAALQAAPRYYRALIALGDIWLREGDPERAAVAARLALEIDSEGALAHLQLSYAHAGMQERARIEIGAVDFAARFYSQAQPRSFKLTEEIFPNYKSLTSRQRIVIDSAVAPLAGFLPKLARSGARHYLLSFDQRVSEIAELDDIAQSKTFDGRYYASIRGVGGRITVSGIEYIDLAARGGFHTIAHEFAHQVHIAAMGREEVRAIRALYEQARREGRTLDYYAASNEFEYFAQGYEAFISSHKRPAAGVTARHTNSELLMRDPQLHRFLAKITGRIEPQAGQSALGALCLTIDNAACQYEIGVFPLFENQQLRLHRAHPRVATASKNIWRTRGWLGSFDSAR